MTATASRAARFDINGRPVAAIGLANIVEVVTESGTEVVPMAPAHCRELLPWRDRWLPVFDLTLWCGHQVHGSGGFLVIVEYETGIGDDCEYGCFRVHEFPKITRLTDEDACAPPSEARWRRIACSGFMSDGVAVPVLRLESVFLEGAAVSGPETPDCPPPRDCRMTGVCCCNDRRKAGGR